MKANISRPQRIGAAADTINSIYKEKFKENTINTMIMCGHVIYKSLYENYIKPYDESDDLDERKKILNELVEKIRDEGINASVSLEEAHRQADKIRAKKEKEKIDFYANVVE